MAKVMRVGHKNTDFGILYSLLLSSLFALMKPVDMLWASLWRGHMSQNWRTPLANSQGGTKALGPAAHK